MARRTYTIDVEWDDSRPVGERWRIRPCGLREDYAFTLASATVGGGLDIIAREISAQVPRAAGRDASSQHPASRPVVATGRETVAPITADDDSCLRGHRDQSSAQSPPGSEVRHPAGQGATFISEGE